MGAESYTIGRGKLLFKPDGYTGGFEDLGNCPDFKITVGTTKKEHVSSRSGIQVKDLEVIVGQTATGAFTLDEPNINNLEKFIMADEATPSTRPPATTRRTFIAPTFRSSTSMASAGRSSALTGQQTESSCGRTASTFTTTRFTS